MFKALTEQEGEIHTSKHKSEIHVGTQASTAMRKTKYAFSVSFLPYC